MGKLLHVWWLMMVAKVRYIFFDFCNMCNQNSCLFLYILALTLSNVNNVLTMDMEPPLFPLTSNLFGKSEHLKYWVYSHFILTPYIWADCVVTVSIFNIYFFQACWCSVQQSFFFVSTWWRHKKGICSSFSTCIHMGISFHLLQSWAKGLLNDPAKSLS